MLTVLGIILVLFSCIAFAVMKIASARERIGTTRQMRDVLKRMADQISFTMEPLPDILSRISQEELGETGEFLDELASQLKNSENRSLQEVLGQHIGQLRKAAWIIGQDHFYLVRAGRAARQDVKGY